MRPLLLALTLAACTGAPSAPPEAADGPPPVPSLETLATWAAERGPDTAAVEGDHVRLRWTTPTGNLPGRMTRTEDPPAVRVEIGPLVELRDAAGPKGVANLAVTVAARSHDLPFGAVTLDAAAGTVQVVLTLPAHDGLTHDTFRGAFESVAETAYELIPELRRAAEAPAL